MECVHVLKRTVIDEFTPFWFVMVMGTGISSNILHSFPYPARWLRFCSYIMFALACLIFVSLLVCLLVKVALACRDGTMRSFWQNYLFDIRYNVFWGTLPMGLTTITNYIFLLASSEFKGNAIANRMIFLVYVLWWIDTLLSLSSAWCISFCVWWRHSRHWIDVEGSRSEKTMRENLQSVLLLPVVPLVVNASSGGLFTMSELFKLNMNRNIQLLTLVVTALIWLHALLFVIWVIAIYIWNLYVNKIPPLQSITTVFLLIGPMGQGAYGILLLTDNVCKYIELFYPTTASNGDYHIIRLAVQWSFKVSGIILGLLLIANGIFFTILSLAAIASYANTIVASSKDDRISTFRSNWWATTFPLGTMALGTKEFYEQYNKYVPLSAFRVVSAIYGVSAIAATVICLMGSLKLYLPRYFRCVRRESFRTNRPSTVGSSSYTKSPDAT